MNYDLDKILQIGTEEVQDRESDSLPLIVQLPPNELVDFPAELHKFKPATPTRMEELVKSIRQNGIINPLIVRKLPSGSFQIIAGHNRRRAAMIAGYQTVPCLVMDVNDDDALRILNADNLLHRELLPSERGWAYRLELEIHQRQGQRTDLTSGTNFPKLKTSGTDFPKSKRSREEVDDKRSGRSVSKYIRLTYLIMPLLDLVDAGTIGIAVGEQLSYLSKHSQETVYRYCYAGEPMHRLSEKQAKELRVAEADPDCVIDDDLLERLTEKKQSVRFRTLKLEMAELRQYFPAGTPEAVVRTTIDTALAVYFHQKNGS